MITWLDYVPQALWWEGVGRCAPIGTDRFSLIAAINTRLVSWAEPLFLKGPDGVNPVPRYRIKVSGARRAIRLAFHA